MSPYTLLLNNISKRLLRWVFLIVLSSTCISYGKAPEAIVAGFEERVDAYYRAEAGKPLQRAKKQPPLKPGRGNFVREYSYSIVSFAARCFYLNESIYEANAALVENAQHYLDNPKDINDRDSFHWHADIVMRLVEMYGPNGTRKPGLLTAETEAIVLKPIWIYVKTLSTLDKAEIKNSQTWHVYGSENHHVMDFVTHWHFSKLAKDRPEYKNLKYDDGATAAEHYEAWNDYIVAYCLERARKGICVEMRSDGYNTTTLRCFYNFYDFGEPQVRRSAGMYIDLYLAYWAEEQIAGHMGGGGSRVRGNNAFQQKRTHHNAALAWFYFGIGQPPTVYGKNVNATLSDYRPPAVIADIATDTEGRGRYEIRQRAQGLGKVINEEGHNKSVLRTDGGGILRYSYCDPAFIIGAPLTEARPTEDWAAISSQSRWQGVIFAGEHDPRIVPIVRAANGKDSMNGQWSVQSKGSMIVQKLETSRGAGEMMTRFSIDGISKPERDGDTVFTEALGAYAAVRVARGDFTIQENRLEARRTGGGTSLGPPGYILIPEDEYSPIILEVMAKSDVENFDAFKAKVKANDIRFSRSELKYTTIYGDRLTFDTNQREVPTINFQPVNYAPKKVYDSPFLNAEYNSGVVTITKGDRKKVVDFNL